MIVDMSVPLQPERKTFDQTNPCTLHPIVDLAMKDKKRQSLTGRDPRTRYGAYERPAMTGPQNPILLQGSRCQTYWESQFGWNRVFDPQVEVFVRLSLRSLFQSLQHPAS
jgi:hypothetical protein